MFITKTRISSAVAALLLVAGLGVGFAGDTGAAHAREPFGHTGANCIYAGKEYGEGSVIKMENGERYYCHEGKWQECKAACVIAPSTSANLVPQTSARQFMFAR
jgi:hypothetical protein